MAASESVKSVTPHASPEAKALLELFYRISGNHILTGQHNYPNTRDRNSQFAAQYIGKTPIIWSTDMGFAKAGDTDSYLARPDIVEEAKRQHQLGSIVTICWHAVPPTADEPVTFRPQRGEKVIPESLATVQGRLLDEQFRDVLTPGTALYSHWCAQVDTIAFYLKKLDKAKVPVLWRPYHEMNGDWFWWGGRTGEFSTRALYRQLFDRFVNYHKLTNLVWVWSVDRPNKPEMHYSHYYPGNEYLDIHSLDIYGSDFQQVYYDSLVALSHGKPLVLGEVGNPPTPEILDHQPRWSYYVTWAGMVRNTLKKQYDVLKNDPRVLWREDSAYRSEINKFRNVCKLSLLPVSAGKNPVNFTGAWVFNEDASILDNRGVSYLPYKLSIQQQANEIIVQKTFIVEWGDDRVNTDTLALDGNPIISEMWNSPMVTMAHMSATYDTLKIESKITFQQGGQTSEMVTREYWSLIDGGAQLSVHQLSDSFWGKRDITMVFDRE
ncbi:hypothetical protein JW960_17955 [candidate division KSB1 bacterium]|nr:hypothetical protein [candidate division KSB1 bacterium]